jgi:DNA-directed RNA polymerase specialized sigma24 family protein
VLDLRLAGYTQAEIAQSLGCAERTVRRKLELIREAWLEGES